MDSQCADSANVKQPCEDYFNEKAIPQSEVESLRKKIEKIESILGFFSLPTFPLVSLILLWPIATVFSWKILKEELPSLPLLFSPLVGILYCLIMVKLPFIFISYMKQKKKALELKLEKLRVVEKAVEKPKSPVSPITFNSHPSKEIFTPPEVRFRSPRKVNWGALINARMKTGLRGEEIVVALEKEYLKSIDRNDLAEKVRHVSREEGDGLGYDVLSYFPTGLKKYIEVKTTSNSLDVSFFITGNELKFIQDYPHSAFIYRIALNEGEEGEIQIHAELGIKYLEKNRITPVKYIIIPSQNRI